MSSLLELTKKFNYIVSNNKLDDIDDMQTLILTYLDKKINNQMKMCLNFFNVLISDINNRILEDFPNDVELKFYSKICSQIINNKPLEPISKFILTIYSNSVFRSKILDGDDSFFMNEDFDNLSKDKDDIKIMFKIKSHWKELPKESQTYIKNAMVTLLEITKQYISLKDDGNKCSKMLENLVIMTKRTDL